ncbi:zinc-binding dehydrogenase [Actinomadura meridiana]|uniref:Zinc-binding dehydrogenase n=1 Tax=Actinomadura meridiana TaxID=559626 RepID=A0ABP8CR85_9ACTN
MRVIEVNEFGGPKVLEPREAPDPVPGPDEVVVAMAAADTMFVETRIRSGMARQYFDTTPPYVPGGGGAGEVIAAGRNVDPAWIGRRAMVAVANGGYADRVVAPVDDVRPIPDGVGFHEAAALLHDGVTALRLFDRTEIAPGATVLIVGATGGMGVLLIQLAKAQGAHVIAAARGTQKLELAREQGADTVLDYSSPTWADEIHGTADVVLDGVGDKIGLAAFAATANGGTFSAHGSTLGGFTAADQQEAERRNITLRGIQDLQVSWDERLNLLERALQKAAEGILTPVIGQTYPLDQAAEAHKAIETRTVLAKTLLLP